MARYDRIARLDPPPREDAFDGWLSLRDLEGREREPELGRRARLRFLALRPVRRLLRRGLEGPDADSFERQIECVREELGQLPARDPERLRLAEYLKEIGGRTPAGVVNATLDVGASAEAAGQTYAAEEFYRTALELSEKESLQPQQRRALLRIGRLYRNRDEFDDARDVFERAAALADATADTVDWARARDGLATVQQREGRPDQARETLQGVDERGTAVSNDLVRAVAAAGLCALELAEQRPEAALEAGWQAIGWLPAADEDRCAVLLNMAAAFRRLGLRAAAESCYRIVERWSSWPEHRTEARVERALVAAEAGDVEAFRDRAAALDGAVDRSDPQLVSLVALGLGRGAMLVGDPDDARAHLRTAISTARDASLDNVLTRAEELLTALEQGPPPRIDPGAGTPSASPSPATRRIAELALSLGRELVPTG